jgi:hypothetical protein
MEPIPGIYKYVGEKGWPEAYIQILAHAKLLFSADTAVVLLGQDGTLSVVPLQLWQSCSGVYTSANWRLAEEMPSGISTGRLAELCRELATELAEKNQYDVQP